MFCFFFKHKTAYEMRISDWSSDVCSSDLREADVVHMYDCCVFRREVLAVIAEGLNARGRWIPVAWESALKDMADKLLDRGCNVLPEPVKDTDALAEGTPRDIEESLR